MNSSRSNNSINSNELRVRKSRKDRKNQGEGKISIREQRLS